MDWMQIIGWLLLWLVGIIVGPFVEAFIGGVIINIAVGNSPLDDIIDATIYLAFVLAIPNFAICTLILASKFLGWW